MIKNNNIDILKKFLSSDETNILINEINEETTICYFNIIEYFAKKHKSRLSFDEEDHNPTEDLFKEPKIYIHKTKSSKRIDTLLDTKLKKIIFTDYKNLKKFKQNTISLNGYEIEKDIENFIKNEFKIENKELILFCKNNPIFLISEILKFTINNDGYVFDGSNLNEKNHILNLRKTIFLLKKQGAEMRSLYSNLKSEALYKKLNFLTY